MPTSPVLLTKNELKIMSLQAELERVKEAFREVLVPPLPLEETSPASEDVSPIRRLLVPLLVQVRGALASGGAALPASVADPLREAEATLVGACSEEESTAVEACLSVLEGRLLSHTTALVPSRAPLQATVPAPPNPLLGENSRLLSSLFRNRGTISVYCRIRPLNGAESLTADAMHAALVRSSLNHGTLGSPPSSPSSSPPSPPHHAAAAAGAPHHDPLLTPLPPRAVVEALSATEASFWSRAVASWRPFAFDRVFGPEAGQVEVAEEAYPLAAAVLEGYKACIMAYGVTGSGKTHSMMGPASDPGLIVRTMGKLFELAEARGGGGASHFTFSMSMLEIYNEQLRDLLVEDDGRGGGGSHYPGGAFHGNKAATPLEIRDGPPHPMGGPTPTVVHGLTTHVVNDLESMTRVLSRGLALRATAATSIHSSSSRSHCVVGGEGGGGGGGGGGSHSSNSSTSSSSKGGHPNQGHPEGEVTAGRLYLVDLAGSERVQKSEVRGARLREAQAINRSLSALGDTLEALDKKASHVPYRNSRLTRLLQDALGGAARTLLIATVGPSHTTAEETLCTLLFAARARRVDLGPAQRAVNFKNLSSALSTAEGAYAILSAREKAMGREVETLRARVNELVQVSMSVQSASKGESKHARDALVVAQRELSGVRGALQLAQGNLMKALASVQQERGRVRVLGKTLIEARGLFTKAKGEVNRAAGELAVTRKSLGGVFSCASNSNSLALSPIPHTSSATSGGGGGGGSPSSPPSPQSPPRGDGVQSTSSSRASGEGFSVSSIPDSTSSSVAPTPVPTPRKPTQPGSVADLVQKFEALSSTAALVQPSSPSKPQGVDGGGEVHHPRTLLEILEGPSPQKRQPRPGPSFFKIPTSLSISVVLPSRAAAPTTSCTLEGVGVEPSEPPSSLLPPHGHDLSKLTLISALEANLDMALYSLEKLGTCLNGFGERGMAAEELEEEGDGEGMEDEEEGEEGEEDNEGAGRTEGELDAAAQVNEDGEGAMVVSGASEATEEWGSGAQASGADAQQVEGGASVGDYSSSSSPLKQLVNAIQAKPFVTTPPSSSPPPPPPSFTPLSSSSSSSSSTSGTIGSDTTTPLQAYSRASSTISSLNPYSTATGAMATTLSVSRAARLEALAAKAAAALASSQSTASSQKRPISSALTQQRVRREAMNTAKLESGENIKAAAAALGRALTPTRSPQYFTGNTHPSPLRPASPAYSAGRGGGEGGYMMEEGGGVWMECVINPSAGGGVGGGEGNEVGVVVQAPPQAAASHPPQLPFLPLSPTNTGYTRMMAELALSPS